MMTKIRNQEPETFDEINQLYDQLGQIFKKTKVSKGNLAKGISMSYQGFLLAWRRKKLTLDPVDGNFPLFQFTIDYSA